MMWKLRNWYLKKRYDLDIPDEVKKFWTAFNWGEEMDGEETGYNMPYFKDKRCIQYKIGDIIPLICSNGFTGHYRIDAINKHGSRFADYASWDDGKQYDLSLHSIRRAE